MGLNRCKLSRKLQSKLVEFFVLEVTARSAASVLGLQPNTTALYYRKLRQLIAGLHLPGVKEAETLEPAAERPKEPAGVR